MVSGVDGQKHLSSKKAKTEIQIHTPHRVNNTQYYVQIQATQPATNTIQTVALPLNLTHQNVQNARGLTIPSNYHPICPTLTARFLLPSLMVGLPTFLQAKRRRHWPPTGGPATKPTVLVPAEWLPLAVGTFTSCSSMALPSFSKQMWPVTTPWLSVPSLRPV